MFSSRYVCIIDFVFDFVEITFGTLVEMFLELVEINKCFYYSKLFGVSFDFVKICS